MHGIKKLSNVCSSNFGNRLTKFPPWAGFPSPSGGVAPLAPIWETAAFGGGLSNGRRRHPNGGATPPGGEGNPAKGGNFVSLFPKFDKQTLLSFLMPCIC